MQESSHLGPVRRALRTGERIRWLMILTMAAVTMPVTLAGVTKWAVAGMKVVAAVTMMVNAGDASTAMMTNPRTAATFGRPSWMMTETTRDVTAGAAWGVERR